MEDPVQEDSVPAVVPSIPQNETDFEPAQKKQKFDNEKVKEKYKLEEKLNGILCCAVCLDLPNVAVYQCTNGHLMCISCMAHLLADARLKDETATCPNCRCEISKTNCIRNLAVEKAISEMPSECRFCSEQLPRCSLENHELQQCQERLVGCRFERIGCPWQGPYHELSQHEETCTHPTKTGAEVLSALEVREQKLAGKAKLFSDIFTFLSYEKVTFSDLQLRPYRTDDFITKLFYETSRFSAFNLQWVLKAHIVSGHKSPNLSMDRRFQYQLVLKGKPTQGPVMVRYLALKGPYGDMKMSPAIYSAEFSAENMEGPMHDLPLTDSVECNKQLSGKNINLRVILFLVQKP